MSNQSVINFNNQFITVMVDGAKCFIDAKSLLKNVFASGNNYIQEALKMDGVITEGGRSPLFMEFAQFAEFVAGKKNAARTEFGETFSVVDLQNVVFDGLYNQGFTSFVSPRMAAQLDAEREAKIEAEQRELNSLRVKIAQMEENQKREAEAKQLLAKSNVNPAIAFANNEWFPVALSLVFMTVIGGFSFEIISETMGMAPWLNVLLSVAYVLFPLLTAIRGYKFEMWGYKIEPLVVVMIIDSVFTAYHVGWLRTEPSTSNAESMHWVLKIVYIFVIPFMQKSVNDMILKIRAAYLVKGYLPKIA